MFQCIVVCLVVFVSGTFAFDGDHVVIGHEARRDQFPHQVTLRRLEGTTHFCGGAIISDRFVLSAAHCTQGQLSNPSKIHIIVGAFNVTVGGTLHTVVKIVNHPKYNCRNSENDISVIQTTQRIVFGPNVGSIQLPETNLPDENGIALVVSGWGQKCVSINAFPSSQ